MDRLEADLAARVDGEVRFDAGSRAAYSTDASIYRQVPIGVVVPRTVEAAADAIAVCRRHGAPVLSRGGGTSLSGQCCNVAVVIDWTKYCNRVVSVDPDRRVAVVEPGIALDDLNRRLAPHGLMVGPQPSTHASCTIGGMIGNNSCGATAQAYGKMADSVRRLEILTYDGLRAWVGEVDDGEYQRVLSDGGRQADLYRALRDLRDRNLALIRTRYPDIPRRVSGYNLDSLLPEHGFHLARALVGSEATLVTVLRAEISLFERPRARSLVVLGYPDVAAAADDVPRVAAHGPLALEGLAGRFVDLVRAARVPAEVLQDLPPGGGWLMVRFSGDTVEEARDRARALVADLERGRGGPVVRFIDDQDRAEALWRVREAGGGVTSFPPDDSRCYPGWEDAAVPPDRLGDYLRDFQKLLDRYGYGKAALYGHFGHGCVHVRIPYDLSTPDGVSAFRGFTEEAADLVVAYGGSLSGEHGDGLSRSELLPRMFGPEVVEVFAEFKAIFDPANRMNPGNIVEPHRIDDNLRLGTAYRPWEPRTRFAYPHNDHRFSEAASRCVGVGKCRSLEGGVMCPSYRATREEEHSTRGRARLLFEMVNGETITDGWRSTEVREALDLCLACKGCLSDCPVNVDMATYKAEFLSHHYAGRIRPLAHYSMGWLPAWAHTLAALPGPAAAAANAVLHAPGLGRLAKLAGGVATQRRLPVFASRSFAQAVRRDRPPARHDLAAAPPAPRDRVVLWPDTFTNFFHPAIGDAAVEVLRDAGLEVAVPDRAACCGLTWISTGQLAVARRVIARTLDVLRDELRAGSPIVVLEPSCAAAFRVDVPDLMAGAGDPEAAEDARLLARQTRTLAEVLTERAPDWRPPPLARRAVAQPHCHQHAVLGFGADREVLDRCGVEVEVLDAGCCGLAGNFGFERGHYDVSMACAEDALLPAIRRADAETLVLADGFSCRIQIEGGGTGRRPVHLAEVLAAAVRGGRDREPFAEADARRPAVPSGAARFFAVAGAVGAVAAATTLPAWFARKRRG